MATKLLNLVSRKGLILAILLLSCYSSSSVWADGFTDDSGITYNITSSSDPYTVEITSYTGSSTSIELTSPVSYNDGDGSQDYTVTAIGDNAFLNCLGLTSISIPSSVTSIGESAFSGCTTLATVTIADESSLTKIGEKAFYGCTDLETFTIPSENSLATIGEEAFSGCTSLATESALDLSSVTSLGKGAFYNCSSLTSVNLGNDESFTKINIETFYGCSALTTIGDGALSNVTEIGYDAFYNCENFNSTLSLSNVTSIGNNAFSGCSSLNAVLDLSSVTSLGRGAFQNCSSLTAVMLTNTGLEEIGDETFMGCSSLTSVGEGAFSNVTSIGLEAFSGCSALSSPSPLNLSNVTTLGAKAFNSCSSLTSVTLSTDENFTTIENETFENCSNLTSIGTGVDLSNITEIKYSAFSGCEKLGYKSSTESQLDLDLSKITGTNLGYSAFLNCENITSVKLSNELTKIDTRTFEGCKELVSVTTSDNNTSISLPSSLEKIEYQAFENCQKLAGTLDFSTTNVNHIDRKAFHNCYAITKVTLPVSLDSISYQVFAGCTSLTEVKFASGASYSFDKIGHLAFSGCTLLSSFPEIPSTVLNIRYQAFYNCSSLKSVTLPSGLTTFGYSAFEGSGLESVTIPKTVTNWSYKAFANCTSLTSVTFTDGLASIGKQAFEGCTSLPEIKLPLSIETLEEEAFNGCSDLETVYLLGRTEDGLIDSDGDITPGDNCFSEVNASCFLVVPEECARFYSSQKNGTEFVGYGAIQPSVDGWKDIPFLREDEVTIEIKTTEGYATHYSPYTYTLPAGWKYGVITDANSETGELEISWSETGAVVPAGSAVLIKKEEGDESSACETKNSTSFNVTDGTSTGYVSGYVYANSSSIMYGTVSPYYNDGGTYNGEGVTDVPLDKDYNAEDNNYAFYKLSYYTNTYGVKELGFYMQDEDGSPFKIAGDGDKYGKGVKLAWMAVPVTDGSGGQVRAYYTLEEAVTGIEAVEMSDSEGYQYGVGQGSGEDVIFNLQGMRVKTMTKGGIYIINGRKVMLPLVAK